MPETGTPEPASNKPRRRRRYLVAAVAIIIFIIAFNPLSQWRQISSQALRDILKAEMTRVSDSVYVLHISPVRLRLFPGAISFDSALVTTDTTRQRAHPGRPLLEVSARGCQLSGVNMLRLIRKQGLYGKLFSCQSVGIGASVSRDSALKATAARSHRKPMDFLRLQREFRLPAELPVINVAEVNFPDIRLELSRTRGDKPSERVALQKFSARFTDVILDPQQPVSERRPLFAKQIALAAEELAIGSGAETVTFKHMGANLGEGSFTLIGLRLEPSDSAAAWFAKQPWRKPWVRIEADSVRFAGIDLARLIMEGKVLTERVIIGGLHATVETDASLPERPTTPKQAVSPVQEAAAAAATGVRVEADTVIVLDGTVRYTGHRPGRPTTNVWLPHFTFEAGDILIDPALPPTQQRPLLAKVGRITLDSARWNTGDDMKELTIARLRLQVDDSLIVARGIKAGPGVSDALWFRKQTTRQTLGRALIDSLVLHGVNYDRLVLHTLLDARAMAIEGAHIALQKDMSRPPAPRKAPRARPALDSVLADLALPTHLTALTAAGTVTYVEHHPGLPDREFSVRRLDVRGDELVLGTRDGHVPPPLLSQRIVLTLLDINRHWGGVRSVAVGNVTARFRDSTLTIDTIRIAPHFSPTPIRTAVHVALDDIRFAGLDFVQLADGHGVNARQLSIGDVGVDVRFDKDTPQGPRKPRPAADSSFTGFSVPIVVHDMRILKGHARYTKVQAGHEPLVFALGNITARGSLALERGVSRPVLEQQLQMRLTGLTFQGEPARGRMAEADINLGDSTLSMKGIRVFTGQEGDSSHAAANGVTIGADSVGITGMDFRSLAHGRAVRLRRATAGGVDIAVRHVAAAHRDSARVHHTATKPGEGIVVEVGEVRVPRGRFRYDDLSPGKPPRAYSIRSFSVDADGITLDPNAASDRRLRKLARHAAVSAEGIVINDDPMNTFTIGGVTADLTDSLVRARGIYIGPTVPDSVWVSRQDHRRTRVIVKTDSLRAGGIDFDRLLGNEGLWVRHGRVFGLDIDAYADKNLKPSAVPTRHSTAQHDVQSIKFPFGVDSLSVIDGEVVYRELATGKREPGEVSFTAITALVTGFTSRGVPGQSPPLRIVTHSTIFGMGKLDASAEVPLTSTGYDATYHGRLGPMPAVAINQFAEKNLPVTIEAGQFEEVTFSVGAKDGHAVGTIVPVYHGLKVRLHDEKAGFFKRLEYSVITWVAREFVIRHSNPAKEGQPPRVGPIDHTFDGETIISFLWLALRGGIEKSFEK